MPVSPGMCSVVDCERGGAGCCPACQTVYCSRQCQQEDWTAHRHICPHPPPLEWFTASTTITTTGQQPPEIIEDKSLGRELRGMDPPQKILDQIQEDLKICQERLERFKNSSRETTLTLSPVRIEQETLVIPDSPIQSLESPNIIVNPVERLEVPDNSISSSSESPATPLESSNKFSLTIRESPDNIIKTKSSLSIHFLYSFKTSRSLSPSSWHHPLA